jgi:enoyl-CoA hydratase/carnithine racemase
MTKATSDQIVVSELVEKVKWVRFNRPHVKNAIGPDSADLVREELESAADEGARVVVLSGNGGSFCSGADLKALGSNLGDFTGVRDVLVKHYHPLIKTIVELPLPVIGAIDGAAAGIGADIALATDLRLMSDRGFLSEIFVNISLIPDGGGTFHLPRLVGLARAMEMAMTGLRVHAAQAVDWGLANYVYAAEEFQTEVQIFAQELATKAPLSLARSKRAMRAALDAGTLKEALTREADLQQELFTTQDFQEGVMAFLEKRDANFQGQ